MSKLESILKQGAAFDRVHALVVQVQNEKCCTNFVPGSAWWLGTNQKKPDAGQLPFWEQLGIMHACFVEHFGTHWMSSYLNKIAPFDALRCWKKRNVNYITVKKIHEESSYGSDITSPVDDSGESIIDPSNEISFNVFDGPSRRDPTLWGGTVG